MTLSLSVTLSAADKARSPYFYLPFDVAEGTSRVDLVLRYAKAADCVIDLGLFDTGFAPFPATTGFRGWSGGARDRAFVATDAATPGYLAGPMPAGRWCVALGLYRLPADPVSVTVEISLDAGSRPVIGAVPVDHSHRPGAGWYKGDLHSHCHHSDAAGSPELLHQSALTAGLDFLAVADHNTISQRRYFNAASSPELVFVRAMEVTTEFGHANVFGLDEWVDFRFETGDDALAMARLVREKGGLLSINHDKPPIPWDWARPPADCMEVWQSAWPALNTISLDRYQNQLARGARLSAIGGSDYHQPAAAEADHALFLGRPTTVLFLPDGLSEANVLAGLRKGAAYITESPGGPHLDLRMGDAGMGELGDPAHPLLVTVRGAGGDQLDLIDAGGLVQSLPITEDAARFELQLSGLRGFVRAEIVAVASRARLEAETLPWLDAYRPAVEETLDAPWRRAISNPIYLKREEGGTLG